MTITVNYELAKKNHMKADAEKALKTFLNGDVGTCFILFPQALNPFLKTLESLGIWNKAMVLPAIGADEISGKNKPAYIVVKTSGEDSNMVSAIETKHLN